MSIVPTLHSRKNNSNPSFRFRINNIQICSFWGPPENASGNLCLRVTSFKASRHFCVGIKWWSNFCLSGFIDGFQLSLFLWYLAVSCDCVTMVYICIAYRGKKKAEEGVRTLHTFPNDAATLNAFSKKKKTKNTAFRKIRTLFLGIWIFYVFAHNFLTS